MAEVVSPEVRELADTPYPRLLDAGITAARRASLPLEHWLGGVRDLSSTQRATVSTLGATGRPSR